MIAVLPVSSGIRLPGNRVRGASRALLPGLVVALVVLPATASTSIPSSRLEVPAIEGDDFLLPPCDDVVLSANGLAGAPPLTITWTIDDDVVLNGNPAILDTTGIVGLHTLTLEVTNPYGTAARDLTFTVLPLGPPLPLVLSGNPSPGLTVSVQGEAPGATEWRWLWGDGTTSPWSSDCGTLDAAHSYPASGIYALRLQTRHCLASLASLPVLVVTGDAGDFQVTSFGAQGCTEAQCSFTSREAVTFGVTFSDPPDAIEYDWEADGIFDLTSPTPVSVHTFGVPGVYQPVVRAHLGAEVAVRQHLEFIEIVAAPVEPIFSDDFETGGTGAWSVVIGLSKL